MLFGEKKVYFDTDVLESLTKDASEQKTFEKKLGLVTAIWADAASGAPATISMGSPLRKVKDNPLFMAVVLGKLDYIKQHSTADDKIELRELLDFSFTCGERHIAEHIQATLNETYLDNKDTQEVMLEYIASSGDFDWLFDVVKTLEISKVPSCCYNELTLPQTRDLKLREKQFDRQNKVDEVVDALVDAASDKMAELEEQEVFLVLTKLADKLGADVTLTSNNAAPRVQ